MGVVEILQSFRIVWEVKVGRKSSRLEFSEKFSANKFDFSDAEDNTSGRSKRKDIADFTLMRTQLTICQK